LVQNPNRIHVVAGALFDERRRVLIAQRPAGKHMAGGWEFPGGKVEPGEETLAALKRELHEELGIEVHDATPLIAYEHEYPHRRVLLDLWVVSRYSGEPQPLDAPALQWAAIDDLERIGLLEADLPMIAALRARR
jgi:8-oxo-dGTP diphosphatase